MRIRKFVAIAVLALFSMPATSHAQDFLSAEWNGIVSYTTTTSIDGQMQTVSGNYSGTMDLGYDTVQGMAYESFSGNDAYVVAGYAPNPFTSEISSGVILGTDPNYYGPPYADYEGISFGSIDQNGVVDTTGGAAAGNMLIVDMGPTGDGTQYSASFQSTPQESPRFLSTIVPEPSTFVMAVIASLVVFLVSLRRSHV